MSSPRRKDVWGPVWITCDILLTVVPTTVRINIVVRAISGEEVKRWTHAPPYLFLRDLEIPSAHASDVVLKNCHMMMKEDRVWLEGEDPTIELTLIKTESTEDAE